MLFNRRLIILGSLVLLGGIGLVLGSCSKGTQETSTTQTPSKTQDISQSKLNATITKVDIGADGKVTVSYKLTDAKGASISRSSLDANRERFSIARIATAPDTQYTSWLSYVLSDVKGASYKADGKDVAPALAQVTGVPVSAGTAEGNSRKCARASIPILSKPCCPLALKRTLHTG